MSQRLFDLKAPDTASGREVPVHRFLGNEWEANAVLPQRVHKQRGTCGDFAIGAVCRDHAVGITVEPVYVQRHAVIKKSGPAANHGLRSGERSPGETSPWSDPICSRDLLRF